MNTLFFELTTTMRPFDQNTLWRTCFCVLALVPCIGQGQTAKGGARATPKPAERCLQAAAQRHSVNPQILRAILQVESAMRPDVVQRNANGSIDVGMAQINSIHFPELAQWGITPQNLLDPCIAAHVAAWHLKRGLLRHGNTWFGVAAYHSVTPLHNARYQMLLRKELLRAGAQR